MFKMKYKSFVTALVVAASFTSFAIAQEIKIVDSPVALANLHKETVIAGEKSYSFAIDTNKMSHEKVVDTLNSHSRTVSGINVMGMRLVREDKDSSEYQAIYSTHITDGEMKEAKKFAKDWVKKNIKSTMTDTEKTVAIYKYMQRNYEYWRDPKVSDRDKSKLTAPIKYQKGICSAFAGLAREMGREAGLEIIDVIGYWQEQTLENLHAWNMVKIDGRWYHIDINYGVVYPFTLPEFCNNEKMERSGYKWEKEFYPEAEGESFYVD